MCVYVCVCLALCVCVCACVHVISLACENLGGRCFTFMVKDFEAVSEYNFKNDSYIESN